MNEISIPWNTTDESANRSTRDKWLPRGVHADVAGAWRFDDDFSVELVRKGLRDIAAKEGGRFLGWCRVGAKTTRFYFLKGYVEGLHLITLAARGREYRFHPTAYGNFPVVPAGSLDLPVNPTEEVAEGLVAYKKKVRDALIREATKRGWCGELDDFLEELGLDRRKKTVVTVEFELDLDDEAAARDRVQRGTEKAIGSRNVTGRRIVATRTEDI